MEQVFMYMVGYDSNFKKIANSGWGCGYVAISEDHPFFKKNFEEDNECYGIGSTQEITYTELRTINDKNYWVIGFDTAHSYNSEKHDFDYVFNETIKLKQIVEK